jgi:hypothetical protein
MRRSIAKHIRKKDCHLWPIDPNSARPPAGWKGWPDAKKFALVLSHDVDTEEGYNKILKLAELEEKMGFRSCFNFVPERYGKVSLELLDELRSRGFSVGVHGLKHDGKLFRSERIFDGQAQRINVYLMDWKAGGFSSPSMHRNLAWMTALNIKYSISTFDTDPFEPQPDGVGTIFPFIVYRNKDQHSKRAKQANVCPQNSSSQSGSSPPGALTSEPPPFFVELPYTLPQDFTLFIILEEKTIDIWKRKLDWIADKGGMALLNTHPDYMDLNGDGRERWTYPVQYYLDFLEYLQRRYDGQYFHALPSTLAKVLNSWCLDDISNSGL